MWLCEGLQGGIIIGWKRYYGYVNVVVHVLLPRHSLGLHTSSTSTPPHSTSSAPASPAIPRHRSDKSFSSAPTRMVSAALKAPVY